MSYSCLSIVIHMPLTCWDFLNTQHHIIEVMISLMTFDADYDQANFVPGEGQGELALGDGDIIQLQSRVGTEWLRGEVRGRQGIFPSSFVEIIEDLPADGCINEDVFSAEGTAIFDFDGEEGELTFQVLK